MGAVGAGGMAAANSGILNTLGSIGMGGVGAATGLPGVLTAALISMVGVKGIKEGYKAFRNYETDKFKVDEKKIEINEKRQLVRKVNLGLRHSTAQLLATPAVNVLSRLKGKDPHSQHMGMLGVIFDTLRNMGLNLNILRQGTVGDFKAGETILKHFEDSEKARKKREEENEGGFFGKVKRKIVNVKDKVVDKTIGSVKRNWLVGAGGATGGLGLATLLGTGLLASGGIGAVGAIGAKLFANKFKKSKEINEQKLNELRDKASEFKNKLGNKDRKSADSINLATTSLPKIAEQQRVYLAKIYEVGFNTYNVLTKIYDVLGGQENLKYQQTGNTEERVYVYELGKFLTKNEFQKYKKDLVKKYDPSKLESDIEQLTQSSTFEKKVLDVSSMMETKFREILNKSLDKILDPSISTWDPNREFRVSSSPTISENARANIKQERANELNDEFGEEIKNLKEIVSNLESNKGLTERGEYDNNQIKLIRAQQHQKSGLSTPNAEILTQIANSAAEQNKLIKSGLFSGKESRILKLQNYIKNSTNKYLDTISNTLIDIKSSLYPTNIPDLLEFLRETPNQDNTLITNLSNDIKNLTEVLSNQSQPIIDTEINTRNLRDLLSSNDDNTPPDGSGLDRNRGYGRRRRDRISPIQDQARSAYKGGIFDSNYFSSGHLVNFSPKGADTVASVLPVGSAVIPREAVRKFGVSRKLGSVVHAARGSVGLVPNGHVGAMVAPGEVIVPPHVVASNRPLINNLVGAGRAIQKGRYFASGGILDSSVFDLVNKFKPNLADTLADKILNIDNNKIRNTLINLYTSKSSIKTALDVVDEGKVQTYTDSAISFLSSFDPGFVSELLKDVIKVGTTAVSDASELSNVIKKLFTTKHLMEIGAGTIAGVGTTALTGGNILLGAAAATAAKKASNKLYEFIQSQDTSPVLAYSGGIMTAPKYFAEGTADTNNDNLITSAERKTVEDKKRETERDQIQTNSLQEIRELMSKVVDNTSEKKSLKNKLEIKDKKTNWLGILAAVAAGGAVLSKFAPEIIEMLKPMFNGLGEITKGIFLDTKLGNYVLGGLGIIALGPALIRGFVAPAIIGGLKFVGSSIGIILKTIGPKLLTKSTAFLAARLGGVVTALFEGYAGFMEEYSKSGEIGKSLWSGLKQVFAVDAEGGAWSAIKGAFKYASYGASIGGVIGGPVGALVGIAVGGLVGGLLGWLGSDKLTEIGSKLGNYLNEIIVQPFTAVYEWIREKLGLSVDRHEEKNAEVSSKVSSEVTENMTDEQKSKAAKLHELKIDKTGFGWGFGDDVKSIEDLTGEYIKGNSRVTQAMLLEYGVTKEQMRELNSQRLANTLPKQIELNSPVYNDKRTDKERMEIIKKHEIGTGWIYDDFKSVEDVLKAYISGDKRVTDLILQQMGISVDTISKIRELRINNWIETRNMYDSHRGIKHTKEEYEKLQIEMNKSYDAIPKYSGGMIPKYYEVGTDTVMNQSSAVIKEIRNSEAVKEAETVLRSGLEGAQNNASVIIEQIANSKTPEEAKLILDNFMKSELAGFISESSKSILTQISVNLQTPEFLNSNEFKKLTFDFNNSMFGEKGLIQVATTSFTDYIPEALKSAEGRKLIQDSVYSRLEELNTSTQDFYTATVNEFSNSLTENMPAIKKLSEEAAASIKSGYESTVNAASEGFTAIHNAVTSSDNINRPSNVTSTDSDKPKVSEKSSTIASENPAKKPIIENTVSPNRPVAHMIEEVKNNPERVTEFLKDVASNPGEYARNFSSDEFRRNISAGINEGTNALDEMFFKPIGRKLGTVYDDPKTASPQPTTPKPISPTTTPSPVNTENQERQTSPVTTSNPVSSKFKSSDKGIQNQLDFINSLTEKDLENPETKHKLKSLLIQTDLHKKYLRPGRINLIEDLPNIKKDIINKLESKIRNNTPEMIELRKQAAAEMDSFDPLKELQIPVSPVTTTSPVNLKPKDSDIDFIKSLDYDKFYSKENSGSNVRFMKLLEDYNLGNNKDRDNAIINNSEMEWFNNQRSKLIEKFATPATELAQGISNIGSVDNIVTTPKQLFKNRDEIKELLSESYINLSKELTSDISLIREELTDNKKHMKEIRDVLVGDNNIISSDTSSDKVSDTETAESTRKDTKKEDTKKSESEKEKPKTTFESFAETLKNVKEKGQGLAQTIANGLLTGFGKNDIANVLTNITSAAPKYSGGILGSSNAINLASGGVIDGDKHQPVTSTTANSSNQGLNLVKVKSKSGKSTTVNAPYQKSFQDFINEFESTGYNIKTLGGYANRNIAGSSSKSYHAFGAAIDINPSTNPMKPYLVTDMPSNTGEIAKKHGLGWGGNWRSKKDAMHFSAAQSEGGSYDIKKDGTGTGVMSSPNTSPSSNTNSPAMGGSSIGSNFMSMMGLGALTSPSGTGSISTPTQPQTNIVKAQSSNIRRPFGGMRPFQKLAAGIKRPFGGLRPFKKLAAGIKKPFGGMRPFQKLAAGIKKPFGGLRPFRKARRFEIGSPLLLAEGSTSVPSTGGFKEKSGAIMKRLMSDFGLSVEQAAGIVGNLGHESGGFKHMQEISPLGGGRGGYGWAQWTGPRRDAFISWCKQNNLDPTSDEGNYGFLKHELQTSEKKSITAVKQASSVADAVKLFEDKFERAGVKNYESRMKYAQQALESYGDGSNVNMGSLSSTGTGSSPSPSTGGSIPNIGGLNLLSGLNISSSMIPQSNILNQTNTNTYSNIKKPFGGLRPFKAMKMGLKKPFGGMKPLQSMGIRRSRRLEIGSPLLLSEGSTSVSPTGSSNIPNTGNQQNSTSPTGSSNIPSTGGFQEKSGAIMQRLMSDFGLSVEQAAGVVGNLGHESGGFKHMQEISPTGGGRGGFGWAQWTGPRRDSFIKWCKENNLDPTSDEGNYGYLKHELQTSEKSSLSAVKQASSVADAVKLFEEKFERAGVKNYESRMKYAQQALASYGDGSNVNMGSLSSTGTGNSPVGTGSAAGSGGGESGNSMSNLFSDIGSQLSSSIGSLMSMASGTISSYNPNLTQMTPAVSMTNTSGNQDASDIIKNGNMLRSGISEPSQEMETPAASNSNQSTSTGMESFPGIVTGNPSSVDPQLDSGPTQIDSGSIDYIIDKLFNALSQSVMFTALTQATGQMPLGIDGAKS
jgi:hypothetical protein